MVVTSTDAVSSLLDLEVVIVDMEDCECDNECDRLLLDVFVWLNMVKLSELLREESTSVDESVNVAPECVADAEKELDGERVSAGVPEAML